MAINQKSTPTLRFKDQQGNDYPDWESEPLSKIGKILTGTTPSTANKSLWNGDLQFITPSDINDSEKYQRFTQRYIKQTKKTRVVPPNSIIYTCIASIGKICISVEPCTTNQQINALTPGESYDSDYVYYSLLKMTPRIKATQSTTTLPIINKSEFEKIEIIVPCKQEQQKIASLLSSVDFKIEQLGKKKSLLKQYKKGIMQKLFSQEIRFKDEQGNDYLDWEGNTLGMLFEISAGGDIENSHSRKNKNGIFRYPIYANSEKEKGLHGYSDRYSVKQNCITVSGRGTLGVAHARFEKFFPIVRLLVLIPRKESNLIFFEHAINLLQIFKESTGVPQLTAPQLKKYHLNYPSIKEQQKIANFLSAIDKKIELVAEQLEQARTYKKGLLQQMFI